MKKTLLLLSFAIGIQTATAYSNLADQNKLNTEYIAPAFASLGISAFAGYMTIYSKLDAITPVTAFYAVLSGFIGFHCAKEALYGKLSQHNENMHVRLGQEALENYKPHHDESNAIEGRRILGSFTYKCDDTYANYGKNTMKIY